MRKCLKFRCRNCLKKQLKGSVTLRCPHCKKELKERDFFMESQIENQMQRDKKYREEVLKDYYKKRDDFGEDEDAYNDYLEEMEDIVYNLREELDIDWAKKQREIQKRKNYEENQKKIGQNILNIEKNEEEFDWDQVKMPGLTVKGSTPQEMMTMREHSSIIQSASGFSNKECHERGISEIFSCINKFIVKPI